MKPRKVFPRIGLESYDAQSAAGRYNPASVAQWRRKEFTLDAGHGDHTSFWSTGDRLFCLSCNYGLGYVGLQSFDTADATEAGSVFMQNASEELRPDALDLAPSTLFRLLSEYL